MDIYGLLSKIGWLRDRQRTNSGHEDKLSVGAINALPDEIRFWQHGGVIARLLANPCSLQLKL